MLLADFHDADEAAHWGRPTDDVVMGGQSRASPTAGPFLHGGTCTSCLP